MQRNYLQVKQFLEEEFPELRDNISGGNYPAPQWAVHLMKVVSAVQFAAIAGFFFGDSIWSILPIRSPPTWYQYCKQNAVQVLIVLFLVIPTMIQSKVTSGAFEIALDENVLFSKLETGRFPNGEELISMFVNAGLSRK